MKKQSSVAVFIDVENIHYSTLNNYSETPDWSSIVDACKQYGRIVSIQAFGDWIAFAKEVPEIQKNGIQPVFVPLSQDGKSSLDCYLTVSAMKLFFQNSTVDTLILASGDRDYIPLLAELKALGKSVIILAVPCTLSNDLTRVVDHVIAYEPSSMAKKPQPSHQNLDKENACHLVLSTLMALEEHSINDRWVNLANIGLELKKKNSAFTHQKYGYAKLSDMLDDMAKIELRYDSYEKNIALARTVSANDESEQKACLTGVIDNLKNGYGFIRPDTDSGNVFFHSSKVAGGSFDDLNAGDPVSYNVYDTERGKSADCVRVQRN